MQSRFKRIIGLCWPHRTRFIILFLCVIVTIFIGSLFNYLFGLMVDQVIMAKSMSKFLGIVALQALVFGVNQCLHYALNMSWAQLMTRFLFDIRKALYESVLNYKGYALSNMSSGDLSARMSQDANEFMNFIHWNVFYGIGSVLNLTLAVGFIAYTNWILALVAVILTPITVYMTGFYSKKIEPITKEVRKKEGILSAWLFEIITGIQEVRLLGAAPVVAKDYVRRTNVNQKLNYSAQWVTFKSERLTGFVNLLGQMTLFCVAAFLMYRKQLTLGGFVAALGYFRTCVGSFKILNSKLMDFPKNFAGIDRVFAALDGPKEVSENNHIQGNWSGKITFESVSFTYEGESKIRSSETIIPGIPGIPGIPVLKDINLEIPSGSITALVGRSGSGKSTMASLLQRYYEPSSGRIMLDDVPLSELSYKQVRSAMGIVHQDTLVFNASVAYNVSLLSEIEEEDKPEEINARIIQVLEAVDLISWLEGLSNGLDTQIGEGPGMVNMSGGQRQRLALARLMFKQTPVLILDEATSSIDAQTEATIRKVWEKEHQNCKKTWLIIAHRLETILAADCIVVLDEGLIVDSGSHIELLARCEVYKELFLKQDEVLQLGGVELIC